MLVCFPASKGIESTSIFGHEKSKHCKNSER